MAAQSWLERAPRPADRVAVESADGALTYAELLARARVGARPAVPPATGSRSRCRPGSTSPSPCMPACSRGAAAMPVDLRLSERERAAQLARRAS